MKKHLLGMLAALVVAGVISLITARRIEAQYSSPVKVMNTTSAPAITSNIDDPGRVPINPSRTVTPAPAATTATSTFLRYPPGTAWSSRKSPARSCLPRPIPGRWNTTSTCLSLEEGCILLTSVGLPPFREAAPSATSSTRCRVPRLRQLCPI